MEYVGAFRQQGCAGIVEVRVRDQREAGFIGLKDIWRVLMVECTVGDVRLSKELKIAINHPQEAAVDRWRSVIVIRIMGGKKSEAEVVDIANMGVQKPLRKNLTL